MRNTDTKMSWKLEEGKVKDGGVELHVTQVVDFTTWEGTGSGTFHLGSVLQPNFAIRRR